MLSCLMPLCLLENLSGTCLHLAVMVNREVFISITCTLLVSKVTLFKRCRLPTGAWHLFKSNSVGIQRFYTSTLHVYTAECIFFNSLPKLIVPQLRLMTLADNSHMLGNCFQWSEADMNTNIFILHIHVKQLDTPLHTTFKCTACVRMSGPL